MELGDNLKNSEPVISDTEWQDIMADMESGHDTRGGSEPTEVKAEPDNRVELERIEAVEPIRGTMAKWAEGFDLVTKSPWPFDCDVSEDFYNSKELDTVLADKTPEEAREIVKRNREIIIRNNEEIDRLNNRILELYEMTPDEREVLFNDEKTSRSDKSLVACVEFWSMPLQQRARVWTDEELLHDHIEDATNSLYGFDVIRGRNALASAGSHFDILTEKERKEVGEGSLQDIASAALESFIMNPNYSMDGLVGYDKYLYGIMLDCTKRKVVIEGSEKAIQEFVDLEEFQARVVESMTPILAQDDEGRLYSPTEAERIIKKVAPETHADYKTGRHFLTKRENSVKHSSILVSGSDEPVDFFGGRKSEPMAYWETYSKRVRKNNREAFNYNSELAMIEMAPWADKIDLEYMVNVNEDESLSCEDKIRKLTRYVQRTFGVLNPDENGESRLIAVKWFRPKLPWLDKMLNKVLRREDPYSQYQDLSEHKWGAFYRHSERSIYYRKPLESKKKLSTWDMATIAHEMWHAKQHEIIDKQGGVMSGEMKARMYWKNNLAYTNRNPMYYTQIMEREAYAIDALITERLRGRKMKLVEKKAWTPLGSRPFLGMAKLGNNHESKE